MTRAYALRWVRSAVYDGPSLSHAQAVCRELSPLVGALPPVDRDLAAAAARDLLGEDLPDLFDPSPADFDALDDAVESAEASRHLLEALFDGAGLLGVA